MPVGYFAAGCGVVRPLRDVRTGLGIRSPELRVRAIAKQKGLSLRVMKTSAYVCTDASLFERIVRNLVSNAVRYTDRAAWCWRRRQDGGLRSRSGTPDEAFRTRSIASLSRVRAARPGGPGSSQGTGPGVAIVDRLARLLDHDVRLRSIPGKGSVFCVTCPAA